MGRHSQPSREPWVDSPAKAVIFDIDGTLADISSIRHLTSPSVTNGLRDFSAFHEAAAAVASIKSVVAAAQYWAALGYKILCVTARGNEWRDTTEGWLRYHLVPYTAVYMRYEGDYRPDVDVKRHLLTLIKCNGYTVVHAYDDNPAIIQLWQDEGIPVTMIPGWVDVK